MRPPSHGARRPKARHSVPTAGAGTFHVSQHTTSQIPSVFMLDPSNLRNESLSS